MPSDTLRAGSAQPIKIAILAMGGEGGGVLADWIVDLAEHNGYLAQTTSVPGVAQRTGATIYYVEMYPEARAREDGAEPVLALMPLPGDVDVVLASELMEAGRAVQRGLVTPDRTTLIASTHRVFSMPEKTAMGDGRVDSAELLAHAAKAARRFIRFDMAAAAEQAGSVVSAVLFGALSAAGVLPFSRAQFEATVERGGVGVKPSLRAFGAAYAAQDGDAPTTKTVAAADYRPKHPEVAALLRRLDAFPTGARGLLAEGVRRLIDYQDPAYAGLYLDRMETIAALAGDGDGRLCAETARGLALWMSFEDTVRVADLKIRGARFDEVAQEVRLAPGQQLAINEYLHPRVEEVCETLPAPLGRWLMRPHALNRLLHWLTRKGRVVTTSSLGGYLLLYLVSRMRAWRLKSLRYERETERVEDWLARIRAVAAHHPALAVEVALCQRLVKGYGDTHARGLRNYGLLMEAVDRAGATLAPAALAELREAALRDEHGRELQAGLRRYGLAAAGH